MRFHRFATPMAVAGVALVAMAIAAAPRVSESSAAGAEDVAPVPAWSVEPTYDPRAYASGADVAPAPIPSVVSVRLVRSEAALARATAVVDQGRPSEAVVELNSAVLNMQKAWIAAKYIIDNAPPPPPPVADAGGVQAQASGAPVGSPGATPEDTAFAVLNLQHEVVTTALGLIDDVDLTLAPTIDATISAALTARDDAIAYIHSIAPPPPPPVADAGGVQAEASGAPVATGPAWDLVMPNLLPLLDDEIQHATAAERAMPTSPLDLQAVSDRANAAKAAINEFWPPAPPVDD
jgi:hypothetical protein